MSKGSSMKCNILALSIMAISSIHAMNPNDRLLEAAEKNLLSVAQEALSAGASVNYTNKWDETPLYLSCKGGHTEMVKLFLAQENVDVNHASDLSDYTPLSYTCDWGKEEIIKLLVAHKDCDVNKEDKFKRTALYYMTFRNSLNNNKYEDIVKLLLERGADKNTAYKNDPIQPRPLLPKQELPELQEIKVNWNAQLFEAAQRNNIELAKEALENGAKINAIDDQGFSPLAHAIIKENKKIGFFLVNYADYDIKSWKHPEEGYDMLRLAMNHNQYTIAGQLLTKGLTRQSYVDPIVKEQNELHKDKRNNPLYVPKLGVEFTPLKKSPAKQNLSTQSTSKTSSSYISPIEENVIQCMLAIQAGNAEMFVYFLDQGIEINSQNHEGLTLLDVAQKNNSKDIIAILETLGAKNSTNAVKNSINVLAESTLSDTLVNDVTGAITSRKIDYLEKLIERLDINEVEKKAKNPLLVQAVKESSYGVISLLIRAKLDINKCDNNGWTPLMQAAVTKGEDVVALLLENGADINLKTSLGYTAYDLAKQNKREDIANLIQGFIASTK